MRPARPAVLHATLLVSGAAVMVLEILGTRVLGPMFGTGVQVWAALITVTLAALALGYLAGGALADRRPSPTLFHVLVVLAGLTTLPATLAGGPVLEACADLGLEAGAVVSAAGLFGPALLLLGMLGPFACRLHPAHAERTGRTVGRLYAVSTLGGVLGGLLAGFVLLPRIALPHVFLGTAGALVLAGCAGLLARGRAGVAFLAAAALAPAALLALPPARAGDDIHLVRDEQSFFQRVQTVDAFGERLLLLDGIVHTHISLQHPDDPVRCEYVRIAEVLPVLRPEARRFLVIGCGGGAMLRLLAAPGRTFDVVDLDPAVIAAAREDFGAGVDGAHFHVADGRGFLRRGGAWDAVLLDVVSTDGVPEHLCTREFFSLAADHLAADGMLCVNSVGVSGGRVLASMRRTLAEVFPHLAGVTAHHTKDSTNVVWLASRGPFGLPDTYAGRRYGAEGAGLVLRDAFNPINHWNAPLGLTLRRRMQERLGTRLFRLR